MIVKNVQLPTCSHITGPESQLHAIVKMPTWTKRSGELATAAFSNGYRCIFQHAAAPILHFAQADRERETEEKAAAEMFT